MRRIFLSHIEKDLPVMQEISQGLEASGYRTWYFERDVVAGTSYLIQITHALENCDAVVLIASPDACSSDQVTKEVVGAFERGKPFFPVLINMTPPELKKSQPEWRHALGGTAMIVVGPEGLSPAITRIIDGLKAKGVQPEAGTSETSPISATTKDSEPAPRLSTHGERKHVTVMFSDLSGYTAMTEKLDPEEVKEIIDRVFGKISNVVARYEGFIEKFVGDAVMALFGVPSSHEDDPIRAIKVAREIHDIVKALSPSVEKRIGKPLSMHTGINTGLVVTGKLNLEKGTHGVLGDTLNIASRLSGLAKADEIMVGADTYRRAEDYFEFKKKKAVKVKGKEEPLQIYKVVKPKEAHSKTHRLSGLRAELIGRKVEMDHLKEAVDNLKQGKSSSFSIIGDAGTGKSRLVEEFKNSLDLKAIQWREGHCYGYSQNIPYFPLIDLLNRAWQIREGDPPDQVRQKVENGAGAILGERKDLIPYIGSLYSLPYPEIEEVSPENWKAKLHEALHLLLANLCRRAPTVMCIEDLHWADPSSTELLRNILIDLKYPVLFICLYRPSFNLFTSHQAGSIKSYHEIRLQDLTPTDAQGMVESLLNTKTIPRQLQLFVRNKAEGNPFYLEEVINSLIETDTLTRDDGSWTLTRALTEKDIPSTVQGVISARLDRLERETKRILQEASVIGRAFLYEILQRISDLKEYIDKSLMNLERLDLIKTRSLQPELEYIFKHALTQEVVYNGLLMKERRLIHEKIALVMEGLFQDHLPEFYETLAYHYSQSDNLQKAYEYLKLSGGKAVKNYANNEAIGFYKEAVRMLDAQPESVENKKKNFEVYLMMRTPLMFLSHPEGSLEIFQNGEKLAYELGDEEGLVQMQYSLGVYHTSAGNPSLGLEYAEKCFNLAEKSKDFGLMAQSAGQLCVVYMYSGDAEKCVDIGSKAISLLEENHREKDSFGLGYSAYSGICLLCGHQLAWLGRFKEGNDVLEKGFRNACEVNDKFGMGMTQVMYASVTYAAGCGDSTIMHAKEAIKIYEEAEISFGLESAWLHLEGGYYLCGEYEKAIDTGEKALKLAKEVGSPFVVSWSYSFLAFALRATGNLGRARECAKEASRISQECNNKPCEGMARVLLGSMVEEMTPAIIEEAEQQIRHGISIWEELKLKLWSAVGYLHLGEFLANAGRKEEAMESLKKAETLYQEMEITPESYWLTRTKDALKKLECLPGTT
ncbi:MAG: AAA family ATPase [Deltaproteobacteria bacterium]|nr:AAA family ATPase [Deltaproteobacteria bacterium]MBN2844519.1 AAA family ATPase [Deltaproteobacteria bacterium]